MNINISEEKKEIIKKLKFDSEILKVLEDEIKELIVVRKMKSLLAKTLIEKEINKEISINAWRKFVKNNKSGWIKEIKKRKLNQNKGDKMIKIGLINFKGGVGKSTIANLLDYEGSVILNIDMQNAKEFNSGDRTIDYFTDKDEFGVNSVKEMLDVLEESGVELVFIDTPGAVTDELLEIYPELDYIIIVTNPNIRDISQTINTLLELQNSKAKIILLHNKWHKNEELEDLSEIENTAKELFKERFIGSTNLKYSRAIPTIDKTKKNILELDAINKVAYITAKKNILKLKNDIAEMTGVKND